MHLQTQIDGPVAVIGDVHGHTDKLARVLEQLRELPDYDRRWIVFIGDLVDRGPDPKGAIDLLTELLIHHPRTTAIAGNHELAMAASCGLVPTPEYSDWSKRWTDHYSAETTFTSYGVENGDIEGLRSSLPDGHARYLADAPWCIDHPEYFFVHAGLDPNSPFTIQREILRKRDFTLSRPAWLCSKSLPFEEPPGDCRQLVVSGHVKVEQVMFGRRRALVDTTGGEDGPLSCLLLPEKKVISSEPGRGSTVAASSPSRSRSRPSQSRGGTKKRFWFW